MRVVLDSPEIAGDTVTWTWSMSDPNPYQTANTFFIRYVGIDPHVYSDTLWLEIWFALMARVLKHFPAPVVVDLPGPLPQASVDYWLARHSATGHVVVLPTAGVASSPWRDAPVTVGDHPLGITFGGGKDSLCTFAMAHELYGAAPLLLLHVFAPFPTWPLAMERYIARMEAFSLRPLEERTGVTVGRVVTDYRANLVEAHRDTSPNHGAPLQPSSIQPRGRGNASSSSARRAWTSSGSTIDAPSASTSAWSTPASFTTP